MACSVLVAGLLDPELAGDEELVARDSAGPQAFADGLLVHVGRSGVDQPVAGFDGVDDAALALVRVGDLEDAEPEHGHLNAVVEGDLLHEVLPVLVHEPNSRQATHI